jgi:tRNA1(Val) A37 N6-methylase TrmN6
MERTRVEYLGSGIFAFVSKAHGFGTDALLLAAFAAPKKAEKACDLGTGCGIIPLLWCRKDPPKMITAVEIQTSAHEQLLAAIEKSGLAQRVTAVNADLRALKGVLPLGVWDLVTINPPYKAVESGIKSTCEADLIARHEVMCTLDQAAAAAAALLRFAGRFCLCHRPERLCDVFAAMRGAGVEPKRMRLVVQTPGKAPWLVLVEGRKGGKPGLKIEPELLIQNGDGCYTEEMLAVYGEYCER